MKKMFVVFLMALALTGCGEPKVEETTQARYYEPQQYTYDEWKEVQTTFNDDELITTFEESERKASPEYWEEVTFNSQKNQYWVE